MDTESSANDLIDSLESLGVLRSEDLAAALERGDGDSGRAVEYLLAEKMVLPEQLKRISRAVGRVVATCFICLKKTAIAESAWTGTFFCEHCYKSVSVEGRTAGFDDELLVDPAERLTDELVVRRLLRKEQVGPGAVEEAKVVRLTLVPRPALWQVLVEDGAITDELARAAVAEVDAGIRKSLPAFDELRLDAQLARRLLRRHLVPADKLAAALQSQQEAANAQRYEPLAGILEEQGELSAHQVGWIVPNLRTEAGSDPEPVAPSARARRAPPAEPVAPPVPPTPEPPLPAPAIAPPEGRPHKGITHRYQVAGVELSLVGLAPPRLEVMRVRPTARLPALGVHTGDAGLDLYADAVHEIAPGRMAAVSLGIATAFPAGVVALILDRSGMARKGLHVVGGVIDAGYRGEWVAMFVNLGAELVRIEPGDRVAQAVVLRLATLECVEVEALPDSGRGAAGFGSTGA